MGQVFSPEALAMGHVPEAGAHQDAARYILGSLFEPSANGAYQGRDGVDAGLVFGSTTMKPTVRSDLDIMVTYDPAQAETALQAIRGTFTTATLRYRVPIEGKVLFTGALDHPLTHNVDPLFMLHLMAVRDGHDTEWYRNNPIPEINSDCLEPSRILAVAIEYCAHKTRKFAEAVTETSQTDYLLDLQRALELPGAIGRKVVVTALAATEEPLLEVVERTITDKHWVTEQVASQLEDRTQPADPTADKFRRLVKLNWEYTALLDSTLTGSTDMQDYTSWLNGQHLPAFRLAHDVSCTWTHLLLDMQKAQDQPT